MATSENLTKTCESGFEFEEEGEEIITELDSMMPSCSAVTGEIVKFKIKGKKKKLNIVVDHSDLTKSEPEICKLRKILMYREDDEIDRFDDDDVMEFRFRIPERFTPLKIIGAGAYGVVISALDELTSSKVAIKVIQNVFSRSVAFQKRVLREVMLLNSLRHENIISLVDLFPPVSFDGFKDIYIVTDLMDIDLLDFLNSKKEKLEEDHIRLIMYEFLKGLRYIHSAGVLHRDIKPHNILLNSKNEVKICDFGLARGVDFNLKMSTHYVATRWYRSPELLMMWDKTSTSIDMWSVGCVMAELLVAEKKYKDRVLFPGYGWFDQLREIVKFRGVPKDEEIRGSKTAMRSAKKFLMSAVSSSEKSDDNEKQETDDDDDDDENNPKTLKEKYPEASDDALDLLDKFLSFDPLKRYSCDDALRHPFFAEMYNEEVEAKEESLFRNPPEKFSFRFMKKEGKKIKDMLYKVIMDWNEKAHNYKNILIDDSDELVFGKKKVNN